MSFPESRSRRLRRTEAVRRMVRETRLSSDNLICPLFICAGQKQRRPVSAMPGQFQFSVDEGVKAAAAAAKVGIPAVILFGVTNNKDELGSEAWNDQGLVQEATRAIKQHCPEMVVITDACFDEYTSHGHCGVVKDGDVDNDATLEQLERVALSQAKAGVDFIAPSGMMDGAVGWIREALDEAEFSHVGILAYSAKYASAFYGPFREAAGTAIGFEHRKSYQMDPANGDEALREVALDVEEGADLIMVKPALAYLDVISRVRQEFDTPIVAYNVSGEYSLLKAAQEKGWIDYQSAVLETLTAIRRAGADLIISYHAMEVAQWLTTCCAQN